MHQDMFIGKPGTTAFVGASQMMQRYIKRKSKVGPEFP